MVVFRVSRIERRFESNAINGTAERLRAQDFREYLVKTWRLAVIPERLMLVYLDHAARLQRLSIPILRIIAIHSKKRKYRIDHGLAVFLRDDIRNNDIAVFFKECAVY